MTRRLHAAATTSQGLPRPAHKGFTLVELLAVIAIIAILVGLLVPTLGSIQDKGKMSKCLSNMRQWGSGMNLYLADHDGAFPEEGIKASGMDWMNSNVWFNCLAPYMGIEPVGWQKQAFRPPQPRQDSIFMCPSLRPQDIIDDTGNRIVYGTRDVVFAYGYNLWLDHATRASGSRFRRFLRVSQILKPAKFAVFGEVSHVNFDNCAGIWLKYRHDKNDACNMVLADGHVETFAKTNVYVATGMDTSQNKGVIWNPEGTPDQWDPIW